MYGNGNIFTITSPTLSNVRTPGKAHQIDTHPDIKKDAKLQLLNFSDLWKSAEVLASYDEKNLEKKTSNSNGNTLSKVIYSEYIHTGSAIFRKYLLPFM